MQRIVPVILCGGAGERLWPSSRAAYPKQFLSLVTKNSLFQDTLARVADATRFSTPIVVTNEAHRHVVSEQASGLGIVPTILVEPRRRDSGPALVVACLEALRREGPDVVVLALAADHAIADEAAFTDAVARALPVAASGHIVTFGVEPDRPETNYGYIAPGDRLPASDARLVASFVEKPDRERAQTYLHEGYLWNSGNFLAPAALFLGEYERFEPNCVALLREALSGAQTDLGFLRLAAEPFAGVRRISIDNAVMERTCHAAVLPVDMGWSDVGTWEAVHAIASADADGNVARGRAVFECARNNLVVADRLVCLLGVDDLAVVSTRDALLVFDRTKPVSIKALLDRLRHEGHGAVEEHTLVHRPWGTYESLDLGLRHQVKRITVVPGGRLSLQKHFHRAEHWVVVCGTASVTIGDTTRLLYENESVYIPIGAVHRLENPGRIPLELIEVQSGSYLGEDDIVRLEDVYRRV